MKIIAGTNVEMSNEEFLQDICKSLSHAEQVMNRTSSVRFHFEANDTALKIVDKWDKERTAKLVEKLKKLGRENEKRNN